MKTLLLECIRLHLGEPTHVDLDTSLIDLGYDSLKFIELILIMEYRFTMEFDDEDLNYRRFGRVSNLLTYIESRAPAVPSAP